MKAVVIFSGLINKNSVHVNYCLTGFVFFVFRELFKLLICVWTDWTRVFFCVLIATYLSLSSYARKDLIACQNTPQRITTTRLITKNRTIFGNEEWQCGETIPKIHRHFRPMSNTFSCERHDYSLKMLVILLS